MLRAAERLSAHPQDHGWKAIYSLFAQGFRQSSPALVDIALRFHALPPDDSATHGITLLGIALKAAVPDVVDRLSAIDGPSQRLRALEGLLALHRPMIRQVMGQRHNSFTGARRFLVPQVLLGAYFATLGNDDVNFADLGTGLGILPRQLNCGRSFNRFRDDLTWSGKVPEFVPIPLARRFGVDRGTLPDLAWVRTCYGPSAYYGRMLDELTSTLEAVETPAGAVAYRELDILDRERLSAFLKQERINAVNLSYVLYELAPAVRESVVDTIVNSLRYPGLVIIMEPLGELGSPGCAVTVYDHRRRPLRILAVSDGHFRGEVTELPPGNDFRRRYPIGFASDEARMR